jgi:hypothetical protein
VPVLQRVGTLSQADVPIPEPYRQVLPDLDLSIERMTERVPSDGHFYLLRGAETLGRYRSLKAAQEAWREVVFASGWKPASQKRDPSETLRREQSERWSRNRAG